MLDLSAQILLLTIFGGVAVIMAFEAMSPLRAVPAMPLWRWVNNLALTIIDYAVLFGVSPWIGLLLANQTGMTTQGLLQRLDVGSWLSFLLLLVSLQFVAYWLHRALHHFPILWRVHAVHHCDTEVDATTAHRHHPIEPLISTLVALPVVVLLGPDPMAVLAYNVLHALVALVSHGNLTLGPLEKYLRRLIVTPAFHRLHHSSERKYTDSNYSTVLPVLDFVFGSATQMPVGEQKNMQLGLASFREPKFARLDQLLLMPFLPTFGQGRSNTGTVSSFNSLPPK